VVRILLLLARFFPAGQTTHVVDLARTLGRLGHDVTLLNTIPTSYGQVHRAEHIQALEAAGVRVIAAPAAGTHPDSARRDVPDPDVIHAHSTLDYGLAASLSTRFGVPYVLTVHGLGTSEIVAGQYLAGAATVIAVGRRVAGEVSAMASRVVVIENGVDTERFRPPEPSRGAVKTAPRPLAILYAGRIDSTRLAAFRALASAACLLAQRRAARLTVLAMSLPLLGESLDRALKAFLDFRGWLADPSPVFREADIVVGSGRVIREGLASGKSCLLLGPVYRGLVSPASLNPALGHDFSGTAPSRPPPDGKRILDDLGRLAEDPGLRQRLAESGRDYALAHLGLEKMTLHTLGVYANARRLSSHGSQTSSESH
jgi:glycosyltransferase involved in cell wall biosynthesis